MPDRLPLSTARLASSVREVVAGSPLALALALTGDAGAPLPLGGQSVTAELRTASGALHATPDVTVDNSAGGLVTVQIGALQTTQGGVYFLRVYVRLMGKVSAALPAGQGVQVAVPGAGSADLTLVKLAAELAPDVLRTGRQVANDSTAVTANTARVEALVDNNALARSPYPTRAALNTALPTLPNGAVVEVSVDADGQRRRYVVSGGALTGGQALPVLSFDSRGSVDPPRYTVPLAAIPFAVLPTDLRPETFATQADLDTPEGTADVLQALIDTADGKSIAFDGRVYETSQKIDVTQECRIGGAATINFGDQTVLRLTEPDDYVLRVQRGGVELSRFVVDADRLAPTGILYEGTASSSTTLVAARNATRDGFRLAAGGNNNHLTFDRIFGQFNGSVWLGPGFTRYYGGVSAAQTSTTTGTVSIGADSPTMTGAGTAFVTMGLQPRDYIRVQGAGAETTDVVFEIVTVDSQTQLTVANVARLAAGPVATLTARPFSAYAGYGLKDERWGDNNDSNITAPYFLSSGVAGLLVNGLYGHTVTAAQFDNGGLFGAQIGTRVTNGGVYGAAIVRPYYEGNGWADLAVLAASEVGQMSPQYNGNQPPGGFVVTAPGVGLTSVADRGRALRTYGEITGVASRASISGADAIFSGNSPQDVVLDTGGDRPLFVMAKGGGEGGANPNALTVTEIGFDAGTTVYRFRVSSSVLGLQTYRVAVVF